MSSFSLFAFRFSLSRFRLAPSGRRFVATGEVSESASERNPWKPSNLHPAPEGQRNNNKPSRPSTFNLSPFSLFALRFSLSLLLLTASLPAQSVTAVESISITVSDLDRSLAFYTEVLNFQKISEREVHGPEWESLTGVFGCRLRIAELKLGQERIQLIDYLTPRSLPIPDDARASDQSFQHIAIVVSDMDRAYARLRAHRVEHASTAPQTLPITNPDAAGIRAFYFRDPDAHFLEVISFPEGKGDPRWHAPTQALFLGIDHTAIVVESTDASLALYRDILGLRIAGTSMNEGDEQAHLNNVEGAKLRITTLRTDHGPGVELLEYLHPAETRPAPKDAQASDIAHWQINFRAGPHSAISMTQRLLNSPLATPISRQIPQLEPGGSSLPAPIMLRDVDQHAFVITPSGG